MSSKEDIARLLNLGGADSTALAEVITDCWDDEGAASLEDSDLFTFFQTALFIQHAVEYSACSLVTHRMDMNVHNNVLILF